MKLSFDLFIEGFGYDKNIFSLEKKNINNITRSFLSDNSMIFNLREKISFCYSKEKKFLLQDDKYEICKYKNIRYHVSDFRDMKKENNLNMNSISNLFNMLYDIIDEIFNNSININKEEKIK